MIFVVARISSKSDGMNPPDTLVIPAVSHQSPWYLGGPGAPGSGRCPPDTIVIPSVSHQSAWYLHGSSVVRKRCRVPPECVSTHSCGHFPERPLGQGSPLVAQGVWGLERPLGQGSPCRPQGVWGLDLRCALAGNLSVK